MDAISRLIVDLEARSVVAGVDPEATDYERGYLGGVVYSLMVLAEHGLVLSEIDYDGSWSAGLAGELA